MKAILVLEMPSSCMGCNFLHCDIEEFKEYCEARKNRKQVDLTNEEKPDWCPLKPIPSKKSTIGKESDNDILCMNAGYNTCIDEILGDKE